MRIRTKLFLLILGILLPLTIFLSILIPIGIRKQMMIDVENKLLHYRSIAIVLVNQTIKDDNSELELGMKTLEIEEELSDMFNLEVSAYSTTDTVVHSSENRGNMHPEVQAAFSGDIAYRESPSYLYFAFPINDSLVLTIQYPLDMINQTLSSTKVSIYAIAMFMIFFSIISSLLVSKTFTKPIIRLNEAVRTIQQGDYNIELNLRTNDEISELATSLDNMSQEIETRISQLKDMVEEEKRLKNLQRDFINNVTHEFRTPLTSIIGYIDLLEKYQNDKKLLVDAIKAIKGDSTRLNDMVERLLYLSSVERYNVILSLDSINVHQLIERSIEAVRIKAKKKDIYISKKLDYDGEIFGDYEMLFRVMVNLLDNGIKYNNHSGRIDVYAFKVDDYLRIIVKDTGFGIDKEDLDRIFQPFYRGDKNRSTKVGGYGLGLSIVKEIIDKHHGEISIVSKKGEGTEIILDFHIE